jgi:hypothetical protein
MKQKLKYSGELSFIPIFSQRVNFHLMPQVHAFDFDSMAKQVKEEIASINKNYTDLEYKPVNHIIYKDHLFYCFHLIPDGTHLLYQKIPPLWHCMHYSQKRRNAAKRS